MSKTAAANRIGSRALSVERRVQVEPNRTTPTLAGTAKSQLSAKTICWSIAPTDWLVDCLAGWLATPPWANATNYCHQFLDAKLEE